MNRRRTCAVLSIALVTVLTIHAVLAQSTTTSEATAEPLPSVENPMGPPPTDCPPGPEPMIVSPHVGPVVGAYPAWAAGMSGPQAALIYIDNHDQRTRYGWGHKFLWIVRSSYKGVVTLRGERLSDGAPVWFQLATDDPTTELRLQVPERLLPDFFDFPGSIFVPSAGCYALEMTWDGGSWRANFSAGRITEAQWQETVTAQPRLP